MNNEYLAYLRSDVWREKRKELMEEVGWLCEACGGKATEVHHKNYDCLGEEESDDVVVCCHGCHEDMELEKGTDLSYGEDYGSY